MKKRIFIKIIIRFLQSSFAADRMIPSSTKKMKMWSLIFFIGTCSAISEKEHWRYVSANGMELRRGIYGVHIQKNTLWTIAPMAVTPEPGRTIDLSNLTIKKLRNNVFDYLANVTILDLSNNKLETIPPLIFAKLKTLQTLLLSNNQLRKFDRCFIGLRNLRTLDLSNNRIKSLETVDLLGLPKRTHLILSGNPLKKFKIHRGNQSVSYFVPSESDRNPWTDLSDSDLEPLVKMWEDLTNVPASSSHGLAWQSYNSWPFYMKLCKSNNGAVESLKVAGRDEELSGCKMITPLGLTLTLNLDNLTIKEFLPGWYNITEDLFETLGLNSNCITNISSAFFKHLPDSIIAVTLEHNSLDRIGKNVIQNEFLKKISFAFNRIEKVDDEAFAGTNLVSISFAHNNLRDNLNFINKLPNSVEELIFTGNRIFKIPGAFAANLTRLKRLEIADNYITHLPANTFKNLKKLQKIDLSQNSLEFIEPGTFKDQEKLLILNLSFNVIKEVTPGIFDGLKKIRIIKLFGNDITRIAANSFSGLRNLVMQMMDISGNKISTIEEGSFSHMTIKQLDLSVNNISAKSLEKGAFELCSLYELFYDSNPLKHITADAFHGLLLYKNNRFYL